MRTGLGTSLTPPTPILNRFKPKAVKLLTSRPPLKRLRPVRARHHNARLRNRTQEADDSIPFNSVRVGRRLRFRRAALRPLIDGNAEPPSDVSICPSGWLNSENWLAEPLSGCSAQGPRNVNLQLTVLRGATVRGFGDGWSRSLTVHHCLTPPSGCGPG